MELDSARLCEICEKYGIDVVVQFGSSVQGADRPSSDLDIAVHLEAYDGQCDILGLICDMEGLFKRNVDLVVLNRVGSDTLRHEIFKHGRPLYDPADQFISLKVEAFMRFGDSEYLRRVRTEALRKYIQRLENSYLPAAWEM